MDPNQWDVWKKNRASDFKKAVEKYGPLNADNLRAIQKEVRRLERNRRAETRAKKEPGQ